MSDDLESFLNYSKSKKLGAIDEARRVLQNASIPYVEKNNSVHFIVGTSPRLIDFWPTTGKFHVRTTKSRGAGLDDMLEAYDEITNEPEFDLETLKKPEQLTGCQDKAWGLLTGEENVFLTGEAGTGKTFLLNQFRRHLPKASFPVVAPTGVAALLVGGKTLHSFFGLGMFDGNVETAVKKALGDGFTRPRLQSIRGVIIDEISMVSGPMLEAAERIARKAREDEAPWGGLKVIVAGDFRQLPPVEQERRGAPEWAFLSEIWGDSDFHPAVLRTPVRTKDEAFHKVLNRVRVGQVTPEVKDFLDSRFAARPDDDFDGTRLYARNAAVDDHNLASLQALPGSTKFYETEYEGKDHWVKFLKKNAPIGDHVILKEGARVMLRKNDKDMRYVNGSLGIVTRLGELELEIELQTGETVRIERAEFPVEDDDGDVLAVAKNFPISLAWATTIHKSQGCTLDRVRIDLTGLWEAGQAYVALSRARRPDGIFLSGWHRDSIKADPYVNEFHKKLVGK